MQFPFSRLLRPADGAHDAGRMMRGMDAHHGAAMTRKVVGG